MAPGSTTKISQEKEKEIINAFWEYDSPTKIARELEVSRATVDYYGAKYKLREPRKKTGNPGFSEQLKKDIIEANKKSKLASRIAMEFNVSSYTVIKYWREVGIPIVSKGNSKQRIEDQMTNPKPFNSFILLISMTKELYKILREGTLNEVKIEFNLNNKFLHVQFKHPRNFITEISEDFTEKDFDKVVRRYSGSIGYLRAAAKNFSI